VSIELRNLTVTYGAENVISDLSLSIPEGCFFTLLGPSGCGKTTLLRTIAGFIQASGGHLLFGGRDVTRLPPHKRNIGMVFQDYALFPDKTVAENVAYGLRARGEVRDGIAATLDYAREVGMPLAIEPLHPMQAADRACINTLEQALDLCDALDPDQTGMLGVALDVYHTWWDPKLAAQIARAGRAQHTRLLAYHVCDWLTPTRDLLNDRGMMGDGVIELQKIRGWVEAAGFAGFSEVEIFSADWWQRSGADTLVTCIARHRSVV